MGSEREILQANENSMNSHDLAAKWQNDLNDFVHGTITNPLGRLRQAVLVTEGLIFGGIAEIDNNRTWETAAKAGEAALVGGILGTLMASRNKMLTGVIKVAGTIGGLAYGSVLWDKYSKDENLTKALDSVYKNDDLKTFNEQTMIANKSLGKEGFDLGVMTLSGGIGAVGGNILGPRAISRYAPTAVRQLYFNYPRVICASSSIPVQSTPVFTEYSHPGVAGAAKLTAAESVERSTLASVSTPEELPLNPTYRDYSAGFDSLALHGRSHRNELSKFVEKIIDGGVGIEYGESAAYKFDGKNSLQSVVVPRGARNDEIVRRLLTGSSVNRIGECDIAKHVALQGSRKVGYDSPQPGDLTISAKEGLPFHETKIGQLRCRQGAQRYAIEGSESYYRGESGNDYTSYLKNRHGEWTQERQAENEIFLCDPTMPDSPFNPSYASSGDTLAALGLKPTVSCRAAAANLSIQGMPRAEQARTIRAVAKYVEQHPTVVNLDGVEKSSAIGKLARELTNNEVQIIAEIFVRTEGQELPVLTEAVNDGVRSLLDSGCVRRAAQAYVLLNKFGGDPNSRLGIASGELFIQSAREAGLSEQQLLSDDFAKFANSKLNEIFCRHGLELIPDLAVCLKLLGTNTTAADVEAMYALRLQNWNLHQITVRQLDAAKHLLDRGILPSWENVLKYLNGNDM